MLFELRRGILTSGALFITLNKLVLFKQLGVPKVLEHDFIVVLNNKVLGFNCGVNNPFSLKAGND